MVSKVLVKRIFNQYFNGAKNFITPNIIGFDYIDFGDEYLAIEKSEGEGLFGTWLYGVSCLAVTKSTLEVQQIDISKAFTDLSKAEEYIKSINLDMFKNADRFGEIKQIQL